MNYMSSEIILHFKVSVENMKIQQLKFQPFKIHECKSCALLKT